MTDPNIQSKLRAPGGRLLTLLKAKKTDAEAPKKSTGVGGRLRAAADRLRGKKGDAGAQEEKAPKHVSTKGAGGAKPRPKKQGPRGS